MKIYLTIGLLVLALIPTGQASFTDHRYHEVTIFSDDVLAGWFDEESFTYTKPHGYTVTGGSSVLVWSWHGQLFGNTISVSTATFTVYFDDTALTNACGVVILRRDAGDAQMRYHSFDVRCPIPLVTPGTHSIEVRLISSSNNPVGESWQSFTLLQTETITDTTLDNLATTAHITNHATQTNTYVNLTHAHMDSHFLDTWVRLNLTEVNLTVLMNNIVMGNISVNNTPVLDALSTADTEVARSVSDFVVILILALLVIWAERSKEILVYVLAVIACAIAALMADSLSWARLIIVAAGILMAARGYLAWEKGETEDDES